MEAIADQAAGLTLPTRIAAGCFRLIPETGKEPPGVDSMAQPDNLERTIDRLERKINRVGTIVIVVAAVFFGLLTYEALTFYGLSFVYSVIASAVVGGATLILREPFSG